MKVFSMKLIQPVFVFLSLMLMMWLPRAYAQPVPLVAGDTVVVVGGTFAKRIAESGYLDAALQAAYPDHELTVWQLGWGGDEVGFRPREASVPTIEDHVRNIKPSVLVMCFGMSESFAGEAGIDSFKARLEADLANLRSLARDGARVIVISPIRHEDFGSPMPTGGDITKRNRDIDLYAAAMREVAAANDASFVDLTGVSDAGRHLTTNGIHPSETGSAVFVRAMGAQLGWWNNEEISLTPSEQEAARELRERACDKTWLERLWYHPTNTAYVWGGRHEPFGIVNFPPEIKQLERMIEARTRAMQTMDKPGPLAVLSDTGTIPLWESTPTHRTLPEDEWTPGEVVAKGTETSLGSLDIKVPEEFVASFTVADGYAIECFASEQEFPELGNAINIAFDSQHRLWVMVAPTYPHLLPGKRPRCKLVILEDTNRDGKADKSTIWADELYIPTGFAVDADGSVYVGQAPDLIRLRDTDGDGYADRREIVASGFAMPDSHHTLGAFEWDPSGGIIFHEGVFCRSAVETPWGTRRTSDAAVWRFEPRTGRLDILSHSWYANPWGHAFDDYGQSVLADASGGANYDFSHVISPYTYPYKPAKPEQMLNRGRPTAGCEIISSRHFPDDVQGSFLVNQSIGFHGTRWDMLSRSGSTWATASMPMDLVSSSDTNFRPVGMEIGPDGTLYIVDWSNPLIGHMQYSVRDPRRDHEHGRIWRVRHTQRPFVDPPEIVSADIPQLLELLRIPEGNTRQLVRRRLATLPTEQVATALTSWIGLIPTTDPLRDRLALETVWILNGLGIADISALERVMRGNTPEARAGAIRMIRYWLVEGRIDQATASDLLRHAVDDSNQLVRLEAVVACGFLGTPEAVEIAARASGQDMDDAMRVVFGEVISYLGAESGVVSEVVERVRYERMSASELEAEQITETVAEVMLRRADISIALRMRALDRISGLGTGDRGRTLVSLLKSARNDDAVMAAREMLLAAPPSEIEPWTEQLAELSSDRQARPAARSAAFGTLLVHAPEAAERAEIAPDRLLEAVTTMKPSQSPAWIEQRLRSAVEHGQIDAHAGIGQVTRLSANFDDLKPWLIGLVDRGSEIGFDRWDETIAAGMAALRELNVQAEGGNLTLDDAYAFTLPQAETLALGERIFHDEAIGCARCHGHDGLGLEGFPPLPRSPWVLGNPERGAAIVTGGLHGTITMPDGRVFNSAMEPLGGVLNDEQVAATLSFVRSSWGNFAEPVTTEAVARARAASPGSSWSVPALLLTYPLADDRLLGRSQATRLARPVAAVRGPMLAILAGLGLLLVPTVVAVLLAVLMGNRNATAE